MKDKILTKCSSAQVRKQIQSGWALFIIGGVHLILIGCSLSSRSHIVDGYETQQRIVWQGTLTVNLGEDIFRMIYFGYDRNHDLARLTETSLCRGVDLLEYKGLLPNGQWMYQPIIIFSDDNFDCYADRVLFDCDGDGVFEKVVDVSDHSVQLEIIDNAHRHLIEADCLKSLRPH
jgi:hypothetical protein